MKTKYIMKSTSGVRGIVGPGLQAGMAVDYGAALGTILRRTSTKGRGQSGPVVIGRDSRPSGEHLTQALAAGLVSTGASVIDLGIVPTPTVALAITGLKASAGVCVTASHNTEQWNAFKFFNANGEFIDERAFAALESCLAKKSFSCQTYEKLGSVKADKSWIERHIKAALKLSGVSASSVTRAKLKVVVDAVNGAGSFALPELVRRLGAEVITLNCDSSGKFPHPPEPTADNIKQLARAVKKHRADLGLACDPDADRLAIVDERGRAIGEEKTLALAVRQVMTVKKSPVVINLSTSRMVADVAAEIGQKIYYSKVGEANVVSLMHKRRSIIGGEGNGGVIYGALHFGRDSLVAAGLVLSLLAKAKITMSELAGTLSRYYTIKGKASLPKNFEKKLGAFEKYIRRQMPKAKFDKRDGLKVDFAEGWVLIRKSNTEPIYRIVVESNNQVLTQRLMKDTQALFE